MQKRILLVDDEVRALDAYRRMLRDYSSAWSCYYAHDVAKALEILGSEEIDVVVTDVQMPGADGFGLLGTMQMHAQLKEIPVIVVTGFHDRSYKLRALDLGALDLLNKPVQREELFARIRSALTLRSFQEQARRRADDLELAVRERTRELEESRLDLIWCLGRAAEARDGVTARHVLRVAAYSRAIAQALALDREFVTQITLASQLHDVGKIGVPDRILNKRGPLSSDERLIMNEHCAIGAEILNPSSACSLLQSLTENVLGQERDVAPDEAPGRLNPILEMASTIALTHHEHFDGGGYPRGLAREAIPIEARIVAIADVYDALRSRRPYKDPYPDELALETILAQVGRQFDPKVHEAFLQALPAIRSIFEELSDEDEGGGDGEQQRQAAA